MNRPINITDLSYIYVSNVLIPDLPLSIECKYKSEGFQELKKLRLFKKKKMMHMHFILLSVFGGILRERFFCEDPNDGFLLDLV